MWPLKSIVLEKQAMLWGFQTHILGVSQEIDGKMFIFQSKPRHVTPQINCLGKTSHCYEGFSTHLLSNCHWKNDLCSEVFNTHLWFQPRHVTLQINSLGKTSHVMRVSTHIYGVSQDIDGKMFIFRVNLGMWPHKLIVLENQTMLWGFQHTFIVLPRT